MFQGLLPIDKPLGLRSSYCVEQVKKILGKGTKVGHGGTLDSSASGVLVLLLGGATRLFSLVMNMPKTYSAVVRLGAETTTCDGTGEIISSGDSESVTEEDLDAAAVSFLGWRMQTPPEVSAVHVKGRRAHEIFRAGGSPEMLPRQVFIESIRRIGAISNSEARFQIKCGKGTYVRAIARDIGRSLGCRAHIVSLRREAVGFFSLSQALCPGENFSVPKDDLVSAVRPVSEMERFLPCYRVGEGDSSRMADGVRVDISGAARLTFGDRCPDNGAMAVSEKWMSVGRLEPAERGMTMTPEINLSLAGPQAEAAR
ncbi:MAG: tRNA pseudouridine(55) synthase TruB [Synergistaceae bacterium]|jgi:tRNA pseudouridine(55) synthase|nr:tRNA pseudouridine(55) synthase TruB [Synergistaceae bacterium]